MEAVFLDLDQPERLKAGDVQHGFYRRGLAGAAVAEQQDVVDLLSLQHGAGVGNDLIALMLVAQQLLRPGAVRVLHRDQGLSLPEEGPVTAEKARAVLLVKGGHRVEIEGCGGVPPGQVS